jgi:hypothetical protein
MHSSNKAEDTEMELFDLLQSKSGEPPLSLPIFATAGPTDVVELPAPDNQNRSAACPRPFNLVWQDSSLGIRIDFLEQSGANGPELVAVVAGRSDQQGLSVVVAIQAEKRLKFFQRSVSLTLDEQQKCGGRVSFGPVVDIAAKLGSWISADAFLLEPSQSGKTS